MKSVTIIISHYESVPFLITCVRQIRKFKHDDINQKIIICDQSANETRELIKYEYGADEDIQLVFTKPLWSGYGIDYCIRYADIKTDYVCQIHTDVVPISNKWLYLPIKLIEENNFTFVGQMQLISLPTDTIYPPGKFFSMAACFNMARTEDYRELSLQGGFTRFHNRKEADGITWENSDWAAWATDDYYHRGSDDDVPAFYWEDKYKEHDKLGLAITGMIATHYGRVIENILFHFCSCRESKEGSIFGDEYASLYKRIHENYSDELIEEMLSMVKPTLNIQRVIWDGKTKTHSASSEELNNKIEELKK